MPSMVTIAITRLYYIFESCQENRFQISHPRKKCVIIMCGDGCYLDLSVVIISQYIHILNHCVVHVN